MFTEVTKILRIKEFSDYKLKGFGFKILGLIKYYYADYEFDDRDDSCPLNPDNRGHFGHTSVLLKPGLAFLDTDLGCPRGSFLAIISGKFGIFWLSNFHKFSKILDFQRRLKTHSQAPGRY